MSSNLSSAWTFSTKHKCKWTSTRGLAGLLGTGRESASVFYLQLIPRVRLHVVEIEPWERLTDQPVTRDPHRQPQGSIGGAPGPERCGAIVILDAPPATYSTTSNKRDQVSYGRPTVSTTLSAASRLSIEYKGSAATMIFSIVLLFGATFKA